VQRFHASFSYQAGSWDKKRRVVAKVNSQSGELFPLETIHTNFEAAGVRIVTPCKT
jgi:hypothetical protein